MRKIAYLFYLCLALVCSSFGTPALTDTLQPYEVWLSVPNNDAAYCIPPKSGTRVRDVPDTSVLIPFPAPADSGILHASKALTSADILALNNKSGFNVIAAPASGKTIVPIAASLYSIHGGTTYKNGSPPVLVYDSSLALTACTFSTNNFLNTSGSITGWRYMTSWNADNLATKSLDLMLNAGTQFDTGNGTGYVDVWYSLIGP